MAGWILGRGLRRGRVLPGSLIPGVLHDNRHAPVGRIAGMLLIAQPPVGEAAHLHHLAATQPAGFHQPPGGIGPVYGKFPVAVGRLLVKGRESVCPSIRMVLGSLPSSSASNTSSSRPL